MEALCLSPRGLGNTGLNAVPEQEITYIGKGDKTGLGTSPHKLSVSRLAVGPNWKKSLCLEVFIGKKRTTPMEGEQVGVGDLTDRQEAEVLLAQERQAYAKKNYPE